MTITTYKPKTNVRSVRNYGVEYYLTYRTAYTYYLKFRNYDAGEVLPISHTSFSGSKDSVSSPGYWMKQPVRMQWRPKRYNLQAPTKPVLRLPAFPPLPTRQKFPPNKKGIIKFQSASSWNKRLQLYRKRYDWVTQRRAKLIEIYTARMVKYEKRLKKFQTLSKLYLQGYVKMKRLRNIKVKPNNPYSRTLTTTIPMTGKHESSTYVQNSAYYPLVGGWVYNVYEGFLEALYPSNFAYFDTASLDTALNSAETRTINKLYGKLNQWNLHIGNLVAERHQSLAMLKSIIEGVRNFSPKKVFRKHNVDDAIDVISKHTHDGVLMTAFGILPLLQDAYSVGGVLSKLTSDQSDRIVVRANSLGTSSARKKVNVVSDGVTIGTIETELERKVKVSYVLEYHIQNGSLNALQGLGLVNPAEIAWELMPWSFVVDWFLPIGRYINSLTADVGLSFRQGTKVITTTDTWTITRNWTKDRPVPPISGSRSHLGSARSSRIVENKVRTVLTTAPVARLPQFKNPVSAYHLIEAISLLFQRFR